MTTIVAFANQKGGVAKTTSTLNVAYALSGFGLRVMVIDADPQASLCLAAGISQQEIIAADRTGRTLYHGLVDKVGVETLITKLSAFDIIPASARLSKIEQRIVSPHGTSFELRNLIAPIVGNYDAVLIDCPPTDGLCTVNALTAANLVVIPCKTDYLSVMGIPLIMDTVRETQAKSNPALRVLCILPTMFQANANHDRILLENLKELAAGYGLAVWEPVHSSTKFKEANASGLSIVTDNPNTPGVQHYVTLAKAISTYGTE